MSLNSLSEQEQIQAIKKDYRVFCEITNPTEAVCLAAVSKSYTMLKDIKNQTDAIIKKALKKSGLAIRYVEHPTEEQMLLAVQKTPKSFFYLRQTPEAVQLEALRHLSANEVLRYVEAPSYPVWIELVKENGKLLRRVPKAFKTKELCLMAVQSEGMALRYVPATLKTEELIEEALRENGCVISLLKAPTEKQMRLAVESDVSALSYLNQRIPQPLYDELAEYVVTHSDIGLCYVSQPSEELIHKALNHSLINAKYIPSSFWTKELLWRVVRSEIYFDLSNVDPSLYDDRIKLELLKTMRGAVGYFKELTSEMIQVILMNYPLYTQSVFDVPDDLKLMLVQSQAQMARSKFFVGLTQLELRLLEEVRALPMRDFSLPFTEEVQKRPAILFESDLDKRTYRLSRLAVRLDPTLAKFSPYFVSCLDELKQH